MNERRDNISDQEKDERHETARQMTEDAMTAMVKGNQEKADKLVENAKRTDSSAVEEVMQELDEDVGSDHTVPDENR